MGDSDLVAITSKVSQDERDQLDRLADERDTTRSRLIRSIIQEHLNSNERQVPLVLSLAFGLLYILLELLAPENDTAISILGGTFILVMIVWASYPAIRQLQD